MRLSTRVTKQEIIPMLTAKEVAVKMGVDRNEVYRLANRGDGLRAYKVGGLLRFKPEDVEAYMQRPPQKKPANRLKRPERSKPLNQLDPQSNLIVGVKFV